MLVIYVYECKCGNKFEKYIERTDYDITEYMQCPHCLMFGKRIISFNIGHRADPTWLGSACEVLQPDGERPIESRDEFNKYLKKHDIVQRC